MVGVGVVQSHGEVGDDEDGEDDWETQPDQPDGDLQGALVGRAGALVVADSEHAGILRR